MPTLVLVHIGTHFPEHINDCISQLQKITDISVHVLINKSHADKINGKVTIFPLEDIKVGEQRKKFEETSKLDSHFKNGFWKYTTMRFFYIYEHVVSHGLTDVFHIENDNLIFLDFLKNLEQFREKQMWCIMDCKTRCIPGFLYFKDSDIVSKLLDTCIQGASNRTNDMLTIGKFRNDNIDQVGNLPIITSYTDQLSQMLYDNVSKFKCLFDGAAVGQYIGGTDSGKNDTVGFINETCEFKCNKVIIEWRDKKPYLNGMPLVNLHIHSKDLKRWI